MRPSRFVISRAVLVLALAAALAGATPARAGFTFISPATVSTISPNDSASWSGFDLHNPTIVSANGLRVTVQVEGGPNLTFGSITLSGAPGIQATAVGSSTVPNSHAQITLSFSQPVSAVSFPMYLASVSIAGVGVGGSGGGITAYDSNGDSRPFGGGPVLNASYTAIVNDTAKISQVTFDDYATYPQGALVRIGTLELQDSPLVSSAPEPSGLTLAGLSALMLLGWSCWRRCRPALA